MAGFKIAGFRGEYPGIEPRHIPDNAATVATDLRLGYGDIRPLWGYDYSGTELVRRSGENGAPRSLYHYNSTHWLHFNRDASFTTVLSDQDEWQRVIFTINDDANRAAHVAGIVPGTSDNEVTDGTGPYPSTWKALGVPVKATAPAVAVVSAPAGDEEDARTVYYCFTQLNDRSEESAPSDPNALPVTIDEGLGFDIDITCTVTSDLSADAYGSVYRPITSVRVYRLMAEDTTRTWLFVGSALVSGGTAVVSDATPTVSLVGDELISQLWDVPPLGLKGVRALPNGCVVGFVGSQVVFSVQNHPYAYPVNQRYTLDYEVVGIGVFGSTVAALTKGQPYLLQGTDPAAMSVVRVDVDQACMSRRSIVEYGDRVVWAAPDGLFAIGSTGVTAITAPLMDKRVWRSQFNPENILAAGYEGLYIAYNEADETKSFYVNPFDPEAGLVHLSDSTLAAFRVLSDDTLYVTQVYGTFYGVYKFDTDEANPYTWEWRSKIIEFPRHVSPGRVQVLAEDYPVEVNTFYVSDTGAITAYDSGISATTRNPKTLSAGYLATDWLVSIGGEGQCEALLIGETVQDIKGR